MPELIKCSHCGKDINPTVAFCPFCGGQSLGEVIEGAASCPRCGSPLTQEGRDAMTLDLCPTCGGLWLDKGEFHTMTAESTVYRDVKLTEQYQRPRIEVNDRYLMCVRCGKLMTRKNFGKVSGVIIDECGRHGVWLDGGELEKIRHFIADGGLERAQDKEIERNRQEIMDLATIAKETAFTVKLLHFFNFKRWLFS